MDQIENAKFADMAEFIYFIFNLFIVDKFISITTRIAFHKQQDLSQTPSGVNKIAVCWYH